MEVLLVNTKMYCRTDKELLGRFPGAFAFALFHFELPAVEVCAVETLYCLVPRGLIVNMDKAGKKKRFQWNESLSVFAAKWKFKKTHCIIHKAEWKKPSVKTYCVETIASASPPWCRRCQIYILWLLRRRSYVRSNIIDVFVKTEQIYNTELAYNWINTFSVWLSGIRLWTKNVRTPGRRLALLFVKRFNLPW